MLLAISDELLGEIVFPDGYRLHVSFRFWCLLIDVALNAHAEQSGVTAAAAKYFRGCRLPLLQHPSQRPV